MFGRFMLSLLLLLLPALATAQDAGKPTVALLRFGVLPAVEAVELGILEVLLANDFIDEAEQAALAAHNNLENDKLNLFWGDAGYDLATASLMVEDAIDQGADVIIAISAPVAQLALKATSDMESPPAIIFTSVYDPVASGLAEAPCLKPDHVTGVGTSVPYDDVVGLLMLQDRSIRTIGVIYNPAESSSVAGAEAISQFGGAFGMTVETAAAPTLPDVSLAAEALVEKGIQAFVVPLDVLTQRALPAIVNVANDNELLVLASTPEGAYFGAAIGAGPAPFFRRGVQAGYILAARLNGEVDISTIGILTYTGRGLGVNLDAAAQQAVDINEQIIDFAGFIIKDGELRMSLEDLNRVDFTEEFRVMVEVVLAEGSFTVGQELRDFVAGLDPFDYVAAGAEYLASNTCTPEMIAEQQAELDAG